MIDPDGPSAWRPEKYDWGGLVFYMFLAALIICFFIFCLP